MVTNGENGMVMPVTPMGGYGYGNGGGLGGDWGSWIILFLIFGMFGFGGNGFAGNGGGNGAPNPWLLAANTRTTDAVTSGFDNAAITSQLGNINGAITNGFSSMEVANCNRAINQMQTDYQNQIASMNQRFADVTSLTAQLGTLGSSLSQCLTIGTLAA